MTVLDVKGMSPNHGYISDGSWAAAISQDTDTMPLSLLRLLQITEILSLPNNGLRLLPFPVARDHNIREVTERVL